MTRRAWSDEDLLECLDMIERQGVCFTDTARFMNCKRSTLVGIMSRLRREIRKHDPDGHMDGTMPARWWERRT